MDAMVAMVTRLPGMLIAPSAAALSAGASGPALWPIWDWTFSHLEEEGHWDTGPVGTCHVSCSASTSSTQLDNAP